MTSNVRKFIMVCGVHNYDLDQKLINHHIFDLINVDEKKFIAEMTMNLIHSKNIVVTLKIKKPDNVTNIKNIYNVLGTKTTRS